MLHWGCGHETADGQIRRPSGTPEENPALQNPPTHSDALRAQNVTPLESRVRGSAAPRADSTQGTYGRSGPPHPRRNWEQKAKDRGHLLPLQS